MKYKNFLSYQKMDSSKRKDYSSIKNSYPLKEYFGGAFSLYGALKCAPCRPSSKKETSTPLYPKS